MLLGKLLLPLEPTLPFLQDWTTAYRLCNTRQDIARLQPQGQQPSLLDFLQEHLAARCQHSHDNIYSLLALAKEGRSITVDYKLSITELVYNVLVACGPRICLCYLPILTNVLFMGSIPGSDLGPRRSHCPSGP